jgi:glutathione S-transferase
VPQDHRLAIAEAFRKVILDQLHGHGLGRHTQEEAYRIGIADLAAISDYLRDKPFFMGEQLTTVDATLYATLANIIEVPIACSVKDFGRSRENLVRYCKRMGERFFPELHASFGGKFAPRGA